ncbi:MAG: YigZ family protein [Candidatus Marinimicrobia bacterium]|nr:YigZ family protein [Candidatus Neomarinimicrobiota bacterium]
MKYTIIRSKSTTYKEKRSEFISYSKPIKKVQDHTIYLKELKSKHPSARHICWAYRLSFDNDIIENSTDAGEPSGSAGIPILNAIKHYEIINCGIFVVRFFGGVKLGKQGLANAYKTAAELVIAKSVLHKWLPKSQYFVIAPIIYFGKVANIIQQKNGIILFNRTSDKLNLLIELPIDNYNDFKTEFDEITQNSGTIKKRSEHDQTKEVRK